MSETTTCAEAEPILVYVCGRRDRPVVALETIEAVRLRGYKVADWIKMEELHIQGEFTKANLMQNLKHLLDDAAGGILIDPPRENAAAEAAYLAGQGKPVVAFLTEGAPTARVEVLHELIGNWSSDSLEKCLDWLAELIKGEKRPGR